MVQTTEPIKKDIEVNSKDIFRAKEEIAKELLQCSAVHQAAVAGDIAMLKKLIKAGASVDDASCGPSKITPLGMVAGSAQDAQEKKQSVKTARWLIDHGANICLLYTSRCV